MKLQNKAIIAASGAVLVMLIAWALPEDQNTKPVSVVPVQPVASCYVGGCSGEVCSDSPGAVSNCIYKAAFACYKSAGAKCEIQTSGKCGWTQTEKLAMCMKAATKSNP